VFFQKYRLNYWGIYYVLCVSFLAENGYDLLANENRFYFSAREFSAFIDARKCSLVIFLNTLKYLHANLSTPWGIGRK
jgi:hypothetical protein